MKMPASISPMLASSGNKPFTDPAWAFEIKLDGYRILAHVEKGNVKLLTRNGRDYTSKYPQIVAALQKWKFDAIVDGEIVVLDMEGVSDFQALQNWHSDDDGPLYYYVFDLLYYNGRNYMTEPLFRRKSMLKNILPKGVVILYCDEIMTYGEALFKMAQRNRMEGIVAKKVDSVYKSGIRTKEWIKFKSYREEEFLIIGYTRQENSGSLISSLLLGTYKEDKLQYAGDVGTGFSDKEMKEILKDISVVKKCPLFKEPVIKGKWGRKAPSAVIWCRPQLVCVVRHLGTTRAGELRHASFKKLQLDRNASDIRI